MRNLCLVLLHQAPLHLLHQLDPAVLVGVRCEEGELTHQHGVHHNASVGERTREKSFD